MKTLALVIALVATPAVADDLRVTNELQPIACFGPDGHQEDCARAFERSCAMGFGTCSNGSTTLYTETYGGRIGIVHGLTKDECEVQRKQALGIPATEEEIAAKKMFDGALSATATAGPAYVTATPAYTHTASDVLYAECRDKPLILPPAPPHAP